MLRGSAVSSQAEDGGLLQAHMAAWICMAPRYSWALSSADGAPQSGVPPAGRSVSLPRSGGSGGGGLRSPLLACLLGDVTFSLLAAAPGEQKYPRGLRLPGVTATAWCSVAQPVCSRNNNHARWSTQSTQRSLDIPHNFCFTTHLYNTYLHSAYNLRWYWWFSDYKCSDSGLIFTDSQASQSPQLNKSTFSLALLLPHLFSLPHFSH